MPEPISGTDNAVAPAATPTTSTETPVSSSAPPAGPASTGAPQAAAPKSALEALQKAAASASSAEPGAPVTPSPVVDPKTPAGAKDQPGQEQQDAAWMGIPEPRRNIILQNARKAEREAVLQEVERQYGWANGVQPEQGRAAFGVVNQLYQDPVRFAINLLGELQADPRHQAALAQAFQQGAIPQQQPAAAKQPWAMPKAKLRADDGTEAFSAPQVMEILEHFKQDLMEQFGQQVQPLSEYMESQEERDAVINVIHESRQETAQLMAEMRQLPHFTKENEPKIAKILESIPQQRKEQLGAVASLQLAYNLFLKDQVFPSVETAAEERVRNRMKEKASAGTGQVVPGGPAPQPKPKKPTNQHELARHMEALAAQGTT